MNIKALLFGYVTAELVAADPAGALSYYAKQGVRYWKPVNTAPLTFHICLTKSQWRFLEHLAEKRGDSCKLVGVGGFPQKLKSLKKRKTLVLGSAAILAFLLLAPSRVWFVKVEGNVKVPEQEILRAATECGVYFGAKAKDVRSEKVKNQMLNLVSELEWMGVNFTGGVATVSVRERVEGSEVENHKEPTNVIASRAGIVTSMSVIGGQAVCKEGQAVLEGELLVTGLVDCKTHTQVTHADAEVYALTQREIQAFYPAEWTEKVYTGHTKHKVSLIFGRKRINLFQNSGILDSSCDKMINVWTLKLPGGYSLPFQVETVTLRSFDATTLAADEQQAQDVLWQFARDYTLNDMIAGEILGQSGEVTGKDGVFCLDAAFSCREMIARQQSLRLAESEDTKDGENN